jgi:hypothetical protein
MHPCCGIASVKTRCSIWDLGRSCEALASERINHTDLGDFLRSLQRADEAESGDVRITSWLISSGGRTSMHRKLRAPRLTAWPPYG